MKICLALVNGIEKVSCLFGSCLMKSNVASVLRAVLLISVTNKTPPASSGLSGGGSAVLASVEAELVPEPSCVQATCLIVLKALLYVMECSHQPFKWSCVP